MYYLFVLGVCASCMYKLVVCTSYVLVVPTSCIYYLYVFVVCTICMY